MNLLLDFLTIRWKNGGGEYTRRVYQELLQYTKSAKVTDVHFYALYDSKDGIAYEDMRPDTLGKQHTIKYIDVYSATLPELIEQYNIDRFFIAMSQVLGDYPDINLANVKCEVYCVTHDVSNEETYYNQMDIIYKFIRPKYQFENRNEPKWMIYFRLKDSTPKLVRWLIHSRRDREREQHLESMQRVMRMVENNPRVHMIAVSDYTKSSLQYNFGIPADNIQVLWSPERIYSACQDNIEEPTLRELIQNERKYYLLVNANRPSKNPYKAVHAFEKFAKLHPDTYLVTLNYNEVHSNHVINLGFLNDSDLANAYSHCYAMLYPSFFEGFGYPPLEAMHYGKPVLCSNATSMPGIFEDAMVWFSPLYETAIFDALCRFENMDYKACCQTVVRQYMKIKERQERDLSTLIEELVNNDR